MSLYLGENLISGVVTPIQGARNIGQIIQSTIPLTDAGLHLLDGSLIQGDGIYSEFVDYMVQKSKKFNPAPFTFSGTASVNSEGITSYLSYDNRCTVSINNVTPTNKIIYNFSGILKSSAIGYANMFGGFEISRSGPFNPTLRISYRYTTYLTITEDEISTYNDNFTDIKIELTATKIKAIIKNNGNTFTKEANINISFGTITGIGFPSGDAGSFVANLKNCSLIVDDTEIFSGYTQQDYFTDETSWQNSVNTYGVCGKFVYDSVNNTVRLPLITGFIEGTNSLSNLGALTVAGLPNITATGQIGTRYDQGTPTISGAFTNLRTGGIGSDEPNTTGWLYDLDASRSSSIYGRSSTVQPQSIKVLYYIVVANSTKTDIEVDIDEIVTDLNNKLDKNDLAPVHCVVETYQNGTSWYRVYDDGWCEQGGGDITTSGNVNFLKPFINTNYCLVGSIGHGNKSQTWEHYDLRKESTNYFYQDCCFDGYRLVSWYACGYIS